ncbi:L-type lectin-domain containing receptor kinase IX.2-like [Bidens hawaiensis]|uniref:L-type lectin-domain containing receptor kinase IX.2-like n=1 Tax=Bidens hawaiensis TaxID=980011 RepID=UPI004049316E
MNRDFEMGTGPRRFSYHELVQATSGFIETNKLGEGGFGGVYKGFLKDVDTYIAVKRVSKTSGQGIKEYMSEVKIISQLRHKNLVELKGWCHEQNELLLVYEFLENGSSDFHLFKEKSMLTWDKRYKIAHGLASALIYLQEDCKECILHRDIKSSNVMLDSNFSAKLGDFGLAKLVDHEKDSQTTILAGTMGYMAPEFVMGGKASKESDVFSFGIVALEIACGRGSIENKARERERKLLEWVWDLYGTDGLLEAADPRLGSNFAEEELKRLMIVGLWCAHPHAPSRPSMRQAIQVLNFEASVPILPSKIPMLAFYEPPTSSSYGGTSCSGSNTLSPKLNSFLLFPFSICAAVPSDIIRRYLLFMFQEMYAVVMFGTLKSCNRHLRSPCL